MGILDMFDADTMEQLKKLSQPDEQQKAQALNMGLLSAGLGMLASNRGYSPAQAASNAIGMGGMHGINSYQRDIQQGQQDQKEKLGMGMMISKMKKEQDATDMQSRFLQSMPGLFQGQTQEAPRPYQGQVSGNFQVDTPEQASTLESDYLKLSKINSEEAAKVKESLVQQGIIKPQMQQTAPNWQNIGQAGVMASMAGLKGGEQLVKMADLMQPNIQYLDTGNGFMPYSKNGMPIPGAQPIIKGMSPKEAADVQARNAELAFKGVPVGGQGLGVQPQGDGLSPEARIDMTRKGQESFNSNWVEKTYQPVQDAGNTASSISAQVQTLRQIPLETGWGTEAKASAASVLAGLGIAPKNAEMFASNAQKFQQVASERLWTVLNNAKGPQTEGDADRAKQTFAALKNTPEANAFILDMMEANANRDRTKAAFYQDGYGLAKKNGEFDRVDREWRKIQPSIWNDPIMQKWVRK